jgi:hypothetical protein
VRGLSLPAQRERTDSATTIMQLCPQAVKLFSRDDREFSNARNVSAILSYATIAASGVSHAADHQRLQAPLAAAGGFKPASPAVQAAWRHVCAS